MVDLTMFMQDLDSLMECLTTRIFQVDSMSYGHVGTHVDLIAFKGSFAVRPYLFRFS